MPAFHRSLLAASALLLFGAPFSTANDLLRLNRIERLASGEVHITFEDRGTGAVLEDYVIDSTSSLQAADWEDTGATVRSLGDGRFRAVVVLSGRLDAFFRVRNGDLDSGGEIIAFFDQSTIEREEGSGLFEVPITFSAPYNGPLKYRWSGNADVEGLTGTIQVNGQFALIPLALSSDDTDPGELESLTLTLVVDDETGYTLSESGAEPSSTTIAVSENDAVWSGSFESNSEQVGFDLELTEQDGFYQAAITSDGSGLIPKGASGSYPASVTRITEATFSVRVEGIGIAADPETLLDDRVTLDLSLDAVNGFPGETVTGDRVEGSSRLSIKWTGATHLNTAIDGSFTLSKPPVVPSSAEIELQ